MQVRIIPNKQCVRIEEATEVELLQIEQFLTRYAPNYRFHPAFKARTWNGKISYFNLGIIPYGLIGEISRCCNKYNFPFKILNPDQIQIHKITLEEVGEFTEETFSGRTLPNGDVFYPYDYQIESAYKILKYRYCNLEVATAGGKSLIQAMVLFYIWSKVNPDARALFVVPRISLVTQMYNDLIDYNEGFGAEGPFFSLRIDEIMSDTPRRQVGERPNVCIGTMQSLSAYPAKFFEDFDLVSVDEAHMAKAAQVKKVLGRSRPHAQWQFGVSGSYPKEDSLEMLGIMQHTGPIVHRVSADYLIRNDHATPLLIHAEILSHNNQTFQTALSRIDSASRLNYERRYIHQSVPRIEFISKLVNEVENTTLLLFFTIEYGKLLHRELLVRLDEKDVFYIDGSVKGERRQEIIKQLNTKHGRPKVLLASFGTFSTGINIRSIANIFLLDSFKSDSLIRQSIGRGLRLHEDKDILNIYDIVDVFDKPSGGKIPYENILYNHYVERTRIYKEQKYPFEERFHRLE